MVCRYSEKDDEILTQVVHTKARQIDEPELSTYAETYADDWLIADSFDIGAHLCIHPQVYELWYSS